MYMNIEKIYSHFFIYVKNHIYEVMEVTGENAVIAATLTHVPMIIEYKGNRYNVGLGRGESYPSEFENDAINGLNALFESIAGHICEMYIKLVYFSVNFDCQIKGTSIHYIDGKFEHRYDSLEQIKKESLRQIGADLVQSYEAEDLEANLQLTEVIKKKVSEMEPIRFIVRSIDKQ